MIIGHQRRSFRYSPIPMPRSEHLEMTEHTVAVWLWRLLAPCLFAFGTFGNILALLIFTRMKFYRCSYLLYLFMLAVADIVVIWSGLTRYWILHVWQDVDIRQISNSGCKFYLFVIYTFMDYSSWILVAVTVERYLRLVHPMRFQSLYSVKAGGTVLLVLFLTLTVVNMHFFWTNGLTETGCGSIDEITQGSHFWFDEHVFTWIDLFVLSLIPSMIMIICNVLICRSIKGSNLNNTRNSLPTSHRNCLTRMLILVNVVFLVTTLPNSVYFIVHTFMEDMNMISPNVTSQLDLTWAVLYLLQFSNYCTNFYLYAARSEAFQMECRDLFCIRQRYV